MCLSLLSFHQIVLHSLALDRCLQVNVGIVPRDFLQLRIDQHFKHIRRRTRKFTQRQQSVSIMQPFQTAHDAHQ